MGQWLKAMGGYTVEQIGNDLDAQQDNPINKLPTDRFVHCFQITIPPVLPLSASFPPFCVPASRTLLAVARAGPFSCISRSAALCPLSASSCGGALLASSFLRGIFPVQAMPGRPRHLHGQIKFAQTMTWNGVSCSPV
jgi:hypothetical protein